MLFSKPGSITTGKFSGLLVGVLDWDGTYWQVAWFDRTHTDYVGGIQVHIDDFDSDGHLELLIQKLRQGTGSGAVVWLWDIALLRCSHLHCQPVWEETLAEMARSGGGGRLNYTWSGAEYQFGKDRVGRSTIVVQRRGVDANQFWAARYPSGVLETAQVLTTTQSIYLWNNTHYSLTEEFPLSAGYSLDMHPMTETLDVDGDDNLESVVHNWVLGRNGLEQTLSIYTDTLVANPTQVFTASFTGMPSAGVSLEDIDGDGELELFQCETSFSLLQMDVFQWGGWPSIQPYCTVYDWDSTAPFGFYRPREEAP